VVVDQYVNINEQKQLVKNVVVVLYAFITNLNPIAKFAAVLLYAKQRIAKLVV
jgi:hypothetical protein